MNNLKTDSIDQMNSIVKCCIMWFKYLYQLRKGKKIVFHCSFVHPRKRRKIRLCYEVNDLLSSEKLRYFDFTTRLHRLATTNSSVLCYFGSNNWGVYIFVFICTVRFQARKRKYIHRFLENVCRDCSRFQEF